MVFYWDILPLTLGCLINISLGGYALAKSNDAATRAFGYLCFSLAVWCLCYSVSYMSLSLENKVFWTSAKYIGAILSPIFWLVLALHLTRRGHWITRSLRLVLGIWAVCLLVIVLTNAWHLQFWEAFYLQEGRIEGKTEHGMLFRLYTYPSYLMIIASAFLYFDFYRNTPDRFHPRAILFLVAGLTPIVADGFQQAGYKLLSQVDQVPLSLLLSSILFSIAILRYRALEILPIAHSLVIQNIGAAVIVVNPQRQILEVNPFAFGLSKVDSPLDLPLEEAFPEFADIEITEGLEQEVEIMTHAGPICLAVRASIIRESETVGFVILGLDITERKEAEQELERRATTDPLTEVSNRRAFFELAEAEMNRAKRAGDQLAILMIDIDHFKKINDTKGHQAGDEVLVALAERATRTLREIDIIARYGGEEFICLLNGDEDGVMQSADRLRAAYDGVPITTQAGDISITISIGVAFIKDLDAPITDTIEKADQSLYESKENGRNRTTLFVDPTSS